MDPLGTYDFTVYVLKHVGGFGLKVYPITNLTLKAYLWTPPQSM